MTTEKVIELVRVLDAMVDDLHDEHRSHHRARVGLATAALVQLRWVGEALSSVQQEEAVMAAP